MFEFPKPYSLEKRLKDFLEPHVDEKYYLSENSIKTYESHKQRNSEKGNGFGWNPTDGEGIANTLATTPTKSNSNYIVIPEKTKKGYAEAYDGDGVYIDRPHQKRGCVQNGMIQTIKTSGNDVGVVIDDTQGFDGVRYYNNVSPSLRANRSGLKTVTESLRIRKLTPRECYRLMGFSDDEFDRAEKVNSNTQLYKQAGNSIVVDVLEELFCMMLDEKGDFYL